MRGVIRIFLPVACAWVRKQERRILRDGTALDAGEISAARCVGVVHPERVRVAVVDAIPPRLSAMLGPLAARFGVVPSATIGMALGYGIFIRSDFARSRALLLHELAHTAQYERLGMRDFLAQYLHECLTCRYPGGALEQEAQSRAAEVAQFHA